MTAPVEYFKAKNNAHWLADALCQAIAYNVGDKLMHNAHMRDARQYLEKIAETLGYRLEEIEEPEPLDAETIAAREGAQDQQIIDAGRGHLVRG